MLHPAFRKKPVNDNTVLLSDYDLGGVDAVMAIHENLLLHSKDKTLNMNAREFATWYAAYLLNMADKHIRGMK